jgi:hypothetical protein
MILYILYPDNEKQFYKIAELEDLEPVFKLYPSTQEIAMSASTLKEAVADVSEYLDGHALTSWVEDTDISKSLRNKAAAIGLSLTTALSPSVNSMHRPEAKITPAQAQQPVEDHSEDFGTHPMDGFLWNVEQIESTGGKNLKHKPIQSGKFKGTRAMGKWGLLKPTVDEIIGRSQRDGTMRPEFKDLPMMTRDKLADHLKANPKIEMNLARKLAEHVMNRQHGNPHKAAFAWLHGHNLHPIDISNDQIVHSDYVSKFKQIDKLNPYNKRAPASVSVSKAEPVLNNADFQLRVRNWYKRREDELTEEPTRDSTFVADLGRVRENELDTIKPQSMMTPKEKLSNNIKQANKRP